MEGRVAVIPIQTGFAETPDLRAYGIYFRVPTIIRIASKIRLPLESVLTSFDQTRTQKH